MVKLIDYEKLLRKSNILPVEDWKHFTFYHGVPKAGTTEAAQINILKKELQKVGGSYKHDGLYAYKMGKEYIYIGKGKPIFNRLKSHYRESFKEPRKDGKGGRWNAFFSQYIGELSIYWIPVEEEVDRKTLEIALHETIETTFEEFK
ncbi:MAG: hypothetical protein HN352_18725 [Bacteroidetes bacterium]|jgi:hypothetical protein|nr:hypothetical protein [Bacteroidota bacterium]